MKLTKASFIFIILGVIIIGGVCLGLIRSQQTDQQKLLQEQLALAQKKLDLISSDELMAQKERLTLELGEYATKKTIAEKQLTFSEDSMAISELILKTARSCGVNMVNINSSGKSKTNLSGTSCISTQIGIEVSGEYGDISTFLVALSREFPTSLVDMVQASTQAPSAASPLSDTSPVTTEVPGDEVDAAKGTINLVIYSLENKSNVE
jgi:hypothetical protein